MEIVKFGTEDLENLLARDPSRLDGLPFGAVLLDKVGKVLKYNEGEAAIAGRTPAQTIGKNFFNDIAPCTKSHQFMGRFKTALADGSVNVMFEYAFDYKMKPTKVRVHMKSVSVEQGIWVFIKRV